MKQVKTRFSQGKFIPKNPEKYIGTYPIIFRSSWENVFMHKCDDHTSIKQWASESIKIPYRNPITGKHTIYVPDFIVNYVDKTGKPHVEVIEIKPLRQSIMEKAKGARARAVVAINTAKWISASKWCAKNGMKFRVMTEADMFAQSMGQKKK